MFIEAADITNLDSKRKNAQALVGMFEESAVDDLNSLLCGALIQTGEETTYVGVKGLYAVLPYWFTGISSVQDDTGTSMSFTFAPTVTSDGTGYGRVITLTNPYNGLIKVSGTSGFTTLPSALKTLLISLILAKADWQSGDNRTTSKSIEDYSHAWAQPQTYDSPLQQIHSQFNGTISKWSLCTDSDRFGSFAAPMPHHDMPWWWPTQQPTFDNPAQPLRYNNAM